jgi:hypothetical protein
MIIYARELETDHNQPGILETDIHPFELWRQISAALQTVHIYARALEMDHSQPGVLETGVIQLKVLETNLRGSKD